MFRYLLTLKTNYMIRQDKKTEFMKGARATALFFVCVSLPLSHTQAADDEDLLTLGGFVAKVEERVEEGVEKDVEDSLEDSVEDAVSERVEESIAERIENDEDLLTLGGTQKRIEEKIEERVEEQISENLEDSIQDSVSDSVAADVEDSVEESVEEAVEQVVESSIEETLEDNMEQVVESSVEDSVEDAIENSVEQNVAENLEQGVEGSVEQAVEIQVAESVEEQMENEIDDILQGIESNFEIDEGRIHKDQWLVMAEPEVFDKLAEEGYLFATVTDLPGMGMRLAEVAAPSSFDITEVRQGVIDIVGKDHAEVDLNHIYTAGTVVDSPREQGIAPRASVEFPQDIDQMSLRIGMIDSQVDMSHPSLRSANVKSRSFAPKGAQLPDFHGTAIASIIVANGTEFQGLAPKSEVYAASVFEVDSKRGEIASTVSLVRALDWLMSSGVDTVNISLAGPPNRLLEAALARARESGVMILAAAGNGGPAADPMYPAAYDSVVAVTAVDASGKVFRLANRGAYLDLAAPGVSLLHARAGGGYSASSGTSFAVPFATTAAARLKFMQPDSDALQRLFRTAQDIGPPGRDDIYGYGLLRPAKS